MHKARALQYAVFALADAADGLNATISNTTITVSKKGGWFMVSDGSEETNHLNRNKAIELIVEKLSS